MTDKIFKYLRVNTMKTLEITFIFFVPVTFIISFYKHNLFNVGIMVCKVVMR